MSAEPRLRHDFASDNTAGLAPEVLRALSAASVGFAPSYGADALTRRAADLLRAQLDVDAPIFFVTSGTAANAIALATLCRPFQSVLAHARAHIHTDETGAPGFFGQGLGVAALPDDGPKIAPATLRAALEPPFSPHRQPAGALSIANATELGVVYSADELAGLTGLAKDAGLRTHLDGARLANAAAAGFELKALAHLPFDIVVAGGAKSGMPGTEAVILLDRANAHQFEARLKQSGQLQSKSRLLAAPWVAMLKTGSWVDRAAHANRMAAQLAAAMPFELSYPVETNALFVRMDEAAHKRLLDLGWVVFRLSDGSVRFMCSWATTEASVQELTAALRQIA
jgi:threonine aldolase